MQSYTNSTLILMICRTHITICQTGEICKSFYCHLALSRVVSTSPRLASLYENTNIPYLVRDAVKICRCFSKRANDSGAVRCVCVWAALHFYSATHQLRKIYTRKSSGDRAHQGSDEIRFATQSAFLICCVLVCACVHITTYYARRTAAFGRVSFLVSRRIGKQISTGKG